MSERRNEAKEIRRDGACERALCQVVIIKLRNCVKSRRVARAAITRPSRVDRATIVIKACSDCFDFRSKNFRGRAPRRQESNASPPTRRPSSFRFSSTRFTFARDVYARLIYDFACALQDHGNPDQRARLTISPSPEMALTVVPSTRVFNGNGESPTIKAPYHAPIN